MRLLYLAAPVSVFFVNALLNWKFKELRNELLTFGGIAVAYGLMGYALGAL